MKQVHVAVAVLFDDFSSVVIARRPEHVHQGGLLEFPGGKVEPGETVPQALARELQEELGVDVSASAKRPLIRIDHQYTDKHVCLDVWIVEGFKGELHGREGQMIYHYSVADLNPEEFPAANVPIIDALKLPVKCLVTGLYQNAQDLNQKLHNAADLGIEMIVLRAPEQSIEAYRSWVELVVAQWRKTFSLILVHGRAGLVLLESTDLPLDGCHLTSDLLASLDSRPLAPHLWLGASCHNLRELELAEGLGCQYGFISPVKETSTHSGMAGIGWEVFAALAEKATFPVFALGGLEASDIRQAQMAGGQGVAAITAWWRN